jgi:ABC-type lipoprotein release transport system permease subunit
MLQLILIAFRNLLAHRRRTLLLGGAIAFVTALFVLMTGLANGMRSTMLESATTLSTGHVNVGGFFKVAAGQSAPAVTGYSKVLELVKREVPEVEYITDRGRGFAKLVGTEGSMFAVLNGLDIAQEPGFKRTVVIREGKFEDLAQPGTILLFEEQVKKLGVRVGDVITLSAPTFRGVNNTLDVRVAAVAADMGMMSSISAYMPAQSLRDLYQYRPDTTGVIQLYLKDVEKVPEVRSRLRAALAKADYRMMDEDPRAFFMKFDVVNREGWTGQKLDVTTWEEELSFVNWVIAVLGLLTFVLTAVLLVIIAVGIMNTLWIAIRERTREVGTLRAIGMQRSGVLAMFMVEALMLSLFGTLLGAALGIALCEGITAAHIRAPEIVRLMLLSDQWYLRWQPGSVVAGVLIVTVCSMLVSLIPSFLAARMKPVTAMHHIG